MYLDIAMPLTLFAVTTVAMLLDQRAQAKLKGTLEGRQFRNRDTVTLVAAMSVMISLLVFIPQMTIMIVFLFSYSMLLFVFTTIFSDIPRPKIRALFSMFLVLAFVAGTISAFTFGGNQSIAYGALAFYGMMAFAFVALLYDETRVKTRERWYLAVLPPALFICLYVFYSRTPIWFPYILDLSGVIFAVLIILYLGSLFTWRTSLIFVGLLTVMDIVLVLFTGTMVSAARQVSALRLPVLITVPTLPTIVLERGLIYMSLGLGDFFFAGILATQTYRKYGRRYAVMSTIGMTSSFFVYESLILNYQITAFPGTLMIICGWLPFVAWKALRTKMIHQEILETNEKT